MVTIDLYLEKKMRRKKLINITHPKKEKKKLIIFFTPIKLANF